ncbi:hypothetical protein SETIT_4G264400v2 [Setaria italica]|uniref:Uncharacterized protein n=1 Tax=Setaria italica TaxID=4555 RepID=A0A368QYU0_SETIT|nr:hypothetical protein SETIT_4G264400v2 [Setaria italica]
MCIIELMAIEMSCRSMMIDCNIAWILLNDCLMYKVVATILHKGHRLSNWVFTWSLATNNYNSPA